MDVRLVVACTAVAACATPLLSACGENGAVADAGVDSGTDNDAGGDSGTDGDADSDTDTDTTDAVSSVITGGRHTCALFSSGHVKCWGDQTYGQLGYGPDLDERPGAVCSLPSTLPWIDVGGFVEIIDGGGLHTCALLLGNSVRCWGYNGFGQLGVEIPYDTIGLYDVPADHAPIDFGGAVAQLSAGGSHSCVLLEGGDVRCWGDGQFGQLGYGSSIGIHDAGDADAIEIGGAASQISAGARHTCAVMENGDVLCWGLGIFLGYGNTENVGDDEVPADVGPVDLGGPAAQVSCGGYHTCALLETGEVLCWGLGDYGALGYGDTEEIGDDEVPAAVGPVDVGGAVVQISCGSNFTCALLEGGDVKCWGVGSPALGYGDTETVGDDEAPADIGVVDVGGVVTQIDTGMAHTCAILEAGEILCWGDASDGRLGYGYGEDIGDDEVPADVGPVQL